MWKRLLFIFNVIIPFSLIAGFDNLNAQVHADFSASNSSGCSPITVKFNNQSTGAISWQWDLGNGTISNLKEPSATYINPGNYTIKLTASNGSVSDVVTKTNFITVYAGPSVAFSAGVTTGCYPLSVPFIDQSNAGSGSIISWQWDFGDGSISSLQNPTHIYQNAGIFNVILTVKNSNGCTKTVTKQNLINIPSGINAFFNNSAAPTCTLPAIVYFYNGSTGDNITSYLWDFGDGTSSVDVSPMHVYNSPGTYNVSLKGVNSQGCSNTFTVTNDLLIGEVKADFTMPESSCAGIRFAITNTSLPKIGLKHILWTFSDGTTDTVLSPKKIFNNPGVYTVTLLAEYGNCSNSVSKTITILPKAAPTFSADVTASCIPPLTVTFKNTSIDGTVIMWDFGDGTTSNQPNPTHTFTSLGDYSIKLTLSNSNGCEGSTTKPSFIHVSPVKISKITGPFQGCVPYAANFSAVVEPAGQAVTYQWDFGDGETSTQPTPTHIYAVEGSYDVKLVVTTVTGGCTDTYTMPKAVTIGVKPTAAFVASPLIVCQGQPVFFTDGSSGGANQYLWFFGDGNSSTDENTTHGYDEVGYKTIKLVAYRNGCADTSTKVDYVYVNPVVANVADSFLCNNQYKHFFSSNSAASQNLTYKWDFGDGTSSTLQNPIHVYNDTGRYVVSLVVNTSSCPVASHTVNVLNEHADFTIADSAGCGSTVKQFTALFNSNYAKNYSWDFGDGSNISNKSLSHISHEYTNIGSYPIKLQITDINNCPNTVEKLVLITKYAPKPNFSVTKNACANTIVTFEDKSQININKIVKWVWDFGDGLGPQTFFGPPFNHKYAQAGLFDVSLTVFDATGCSDSIYVEAVINIGKPIAYFAAASPIVCLNTSLQFYNGSVGSIVSYLWDFGDGANSTEYFPTHTYISSGTYDVKLIVKDEIGCIDTFLHPAYISVGDAKAHFSMSDSISNCPPLSIKFTNNSIYTSNYLWDFGDGNTSTLSNPTHTYTYPGSYKVKLLGSSFGTCYDSAGNHVEIGGPRGTFKYDPILGCTPLNVHFSNNTFNAVYYTWDFDDGFAVRNKNTVETHAYTILGTYLPKIILEDSAGCKVPIYGSDSIKVKGVEAHIQQLPNYLICDSATITFKDSAITNDVVNSFLWSFGDGQTSNQENPIHKYTVSGNYKVNYKIITAAGCVAADTLKVPIKIVQSPNIAFIAPAAFCVPANIKFSGQWINQDTSILSWKWDFGNGNLGDVQNPTGQLYTKPGNYTISAIATNSSGCADTVKHTLAVFSLPIIDAGPNKFICVGQSTMLAASGADTYTWKSSKALSCLECYNPIAKPTSTKMFTVTGTDVHGCWAQDSVLVQVKQPFVISVAIGDTLCIGQSYHLTAFGAEKYIWSPATFLNNPAIANPISTPDSTIRYRVIGSDTIGCFTDTGFITIKVYPIPKVDIIEGKITVTAGSTLQLHTNISSDVTSLHWSPAIGLSCVNCSNPIASPKEDITYTLTATNAGGCTAKDNVDLLVVCGQGNIFIPNTFSPNNDGVNDIFYPRGRGIYGIKGMRVFSRWGELIYEKTNFQPNEISSGWDGSFKGQKLTPDVYVYIIDVICENNNIFTLKGNVTLLK